MRIKALVVASTIALASLAVASPADAARGSNCPRGWTLESVDVVLSTDYTGVVDQVNHDGLLCIQYFPSGVGIFIDNVAP